MIGIRRASWGLPVVFTALLIVGTQAPSSAAPIAGGNGQKDVTIGFTAVVESVGNFEGAPLGDLQPGSVLTGTYKYKLTTRDTNPISGVGDYLHTKSGYGIRVDAGSFVAQTDPANVHFLVEIVNDYSGSDNYLLRSYNNTSTGPQVSHIAWQLDDPSQTALASEELPTTPPELSSWQSIFGLTVEGEPGWFVRAHVTEVHRIGRD